MRSRSSQHDAQRRASARLARALDEATGGQQGTRVLPSGRRRRVVTLATAVLVVVVGTASAIGGVRAFVLDRGLVGLSPVGATPERAGDRRARDRRLRVLRRGREDHPVATFENAGAYVPGKRERVAGSRSSPRPGRKRQKRPEHGRTRSLSPCRNATRVARQSIMARRTVRCRSTPADRPRSAAPTESWLSGLRLRPRRCEFRRCPLGVV